MCKRIFRQFLSLDLASTSRDERTKMHSISPKTFLLLEKEKKSLPTRLFPFCSFPNGTFISLSPSSLCIRCVKCRRRRPQRKIPPASKRFSLPSPELENFIFIFCLQSPRLPPIISPLFQDVKQRCSSPPLPPFSLFCSLFGQDRESPPMFLPFS